MGRNLFPYYVLANLLQIPAIPTEYAEFLKVSLKNFCDDSEVKTVLTKKFLENRVELTADDKIFEILEYLLEGSSMTDGILLDSLAEVLLNSSGTFAKNAKFGKIVAGVVKRLPDNVDRNTLDKFF